MMFLEMGCFMPVGIYAKHTKEKENINVIIDILNLDGSESIYLNEKISSIDVNKGINEIINKIKNSNVMDIIKENNQKMKELYKL